MSFWDNNKGNFKAAGIATAKGIGSGTKAIGKAGYRTYKNGGISSGGRSSGAEAAPEEVSHDTGVSLPPPSTDSEHLKSLPAPPKRNVPIFDVPKRGAQAQNSAYRPTPASQPLQAAPSQQPQQYQADVMITGVGTPQYGGNAPSGAGVVGTNPPPPPPRISESPSAMTPDSSGRVVPPPPYRYESSSAVQPIPHNQTTESFQQYSAPVMHANNNGMVNRSNSGLPPPQMAGENIHKDVSTQKRSSLPPPESFAPPPVHKAVSAAKQGLNKATQSATTINPSQANASGYSTAIYNSSIDGTKSGVGPPPPPIYRGPEDAKPASSSIGGAMVTQNQSNSNTPTPPPPPRRQGQIGESGVSTYAVPTLPVRPSSGAKKTPPPKPTKKPNGLNSATEQSEFNATTSSNVSDNRGIKISQFNPLSSGGIADITRELESKAKVRGDSNAGNGSLTYSASSVSQLSFKPADDFSTGTRQEAGSGSLQYPVPTKPKPDIKPKPQFKQKPEQYKKPEIKAKPVVKPKPGIKRTETTDSQKMLDSTSNIASQEPIKVEAPPPPPPARNYRRPKVAPPPPQLDLELERGWFKDLHNSYVPRVLQDTIRKSSYQTSRTSQGYVTSTLHKRTEKIILPDLTIVQYDITWKDDDLKTAKADLVKHVPSPLTDKKQTEADLISYHERFGNYIAAWCEHHMGEKVGSGECYDLAQYALKKGCGNHAFASTYYIHGYPILNVKNEGAGVEFSNNMDTVRRGDIIQYKSCIFYNSEMGRTSTVGSPDHTSVVLGRDGNKIIIAEQNANNVKSVIKSEVVLSDLTKGSLTCFRAVPAEWLQNIDTL